MQVLLDKGPMLDEYFRIGLDAACQACGGLPALVGLPDLLESYTPSPEAIPLFLLRLATEVRVSLFVWGGGVCVSGCVYVPGPVFHGRGWYRERGKTPPHTHTTTSARSTTTTAMVMVPHCP